MRCTQGTTNTKVGKRELVLSVGKARMLTVMHAYMPSKLNLCSVVATLPIKVDQEYQRVESYPYLMVESNIDYRLPISGGRQVGSGT